MNLFKRIWQSSLGKKYVMAITGGILAIFVIGHMLGNLQVFLGPERIDACGYALQHAPILLWSARVGLLLTVVVHVVAAIQLSHENSAARPIGYAHDRVVGATYASRTMLMSGLIVTAFVIYHLLHFTARTTAINLTGKNFAELVDPVGHFEIYRMMVLGFQQPLVSGFYILGMALLCLHLRHGIASMAQSLGLRTPGNERFFAGLAWATATVVFVGNCSIPIAVLCGFGS